MVAVDGPSWEFGYGPNFAVLKKPVGDQPYFNLCKTDKSFGQADPLIIMCMNKEKAPTSSSLSEQSATSYKMEEARNVVAVSSWKQLSRDRS